MPTPKGTILLTGANGGLGNALVSRITSAPEFVGYYGIYTVRDVATAASLRSTLQKASPSHLYEILSLDVSRLASVREIATAINARVEAGEVPPIRALILGAGYIEYNTQSWSEDGFDMSFASNYLGHWLLTLLLLQSMDREMGRIIVVSSFSYDPYDKRNGPIPQKWKDIIHDTTEPIAKGTWSVTREDPSWRTGFRRYGAAKLCQVMMIKELQQRLDTDEALKNISILGVDPGAFSSGVARRSAWPIRILIYGVVIPVLASIMTWLQPNGSLRTQAKAAQDVLMAAFSCDAPLGERPRGMYMDGSVSKEVSTEARDPKKRDILWKDSIAYTQLKEEETILTNWK